MFGVWTCELFCWNHWNTVYSTLEAVLLWYNFHLLHRQWQTLPTATSLCLGHSKAYSEFSVSGQRSLLRRQTFWWKRCLNLSTTHERGRKNALIGQVRARIMEGAGTSLALQFSTWIKEDCELSQFSGSSSMYQHSYVQNVYLVSVKLGLLPNGIQLNK